VSGVPVQEALAEGTIHVVLQPIVDLDLKQVFGQEVLVRGSSPGLRTPAELLRSAIDHEYMGTLGRRLRAMGIAACPDARVFLNVHPNEFAEGFLVRPDDPIFTHDHEVYLEVTESIPITQFGLSQGALEEIRGKGVHLVVDDLGSGYSNLRYIADLQPDMVKIDRVMIEDLPTHPRLQVLLGSIVRMCEDMGAEVVAEGVETVEQLQIVRDSGIHYVQGYFIARPAFPAPPIDWDKLDVHAAPRKTLRSGS
jgi:EAL domain-containing protein (putative c-di-GMP-specific phosphodiesterase class I)